MRVSGEISTDCQYGASCDEDKTYRAQRNLASRW